MSTSRVALVTGGARRLGADIVRSLAARGYHVLLHHGHSAEEAESLARELETTYADASVRVVVMQEDLADAAAPARLVDAAIAHFGALDVVVSSASVMTAVPMAQVTPEQWVQTEAVNLRAPFFLMQAAARAMRDDGVIVQLSDHLAVETGFPHLMPHQITKSALTQLVRAMATTLAPRIRVNAVAPGFVLAPEHFGASRVAAFLTDVPLARVGSPADVVHAIHYLIDATYVTGEIVTVDGGRHLRR